jgi:hypothetical protein
MTFDPPICVSDPLIVGACEESWRVSAIYKTVSWFRTREMTTHCAPKRHTAEINASMWDATRSQQGANSVASDQQVTGINAQEKSGWCPSTRPRRWTPSCQLLFIFRVSKNIQTNFGAFRLRKPWPIPYFCQKLPKVLTSGCLSPDVFISDRSRDVR